MCSYLKTGDILLKIFQLCILQEDCRNSAKATVNITTHAYDANNVNHEE